MSNIDDMLMFARVVEKASFTAVADEMELSRSLVSKRITALEKRIGTRLLNRTTRQISLTEAGETYYRYCAQVRATIEEAEQIMEGMGQEPHGRLRINVPVAFGELFIAPLITGFLTAYPKISIDMYMDERVVDLVEGGFDMGLRIGQLPDSSIIARRLTSTQLHLLASPDYLKRMGVPQHPDDLRQHNCLTYRYEGDRPGVLHLSNKKDQIAVPIDGNLRCDNGTALTQAAVDGLGIIYSPEVLVQKQLQSGELVSILKDWAQAELGIHAVFPGPGRPPVKAKVFADYLAEALPK